MIKKVAKVVSLKDKSFKNSDLKYWLSRPCKERIEAVEMLRRQYNGSSGRLQRVVKVVKQK